MTIVLGNRLPADLAQVSDLDSFKLGVSQINEGLDGVYWLENNDHFLILIRE